MIILNDEAYGIVSGGYCMARRFLFIVYRNFCKGKCVMVFCADFLLFVADNSLEGMRERVGKIQNTDENRGFYLVQLVTVHRQT